MSLTALELREKHFKIRFWDLYYENLHIDCYRFCEQCEDLFEIAKAKRPNEIPFAGLFLRRIVSYCWFQYKKQHNGAIAII